MQCAACRACLLGLLAAISLPGEIGGKDLTGITTTHPSHHPQPDSAGHLQSDTYSKQTDMNSTFSLGESIRDFAEFSANLNNKYRAVEMATDISSMVREMVQSLSEIQVRGETMMKNILIQQRKLKTVVEETDRNKKYLTLLKTQVGSMEKKRSSLLKDVGTMEEKRTVLFEQIKTMAEKGSTLQNQIDDLTAKKEDVEKELSSATREFQGRKLKKQSEIERMKQELSDYETKITEASKILSKIEADNKAKLEELQQLKQLRQLEEEKEAKAVSTNLTKTNDSNEGAGSDLGKVDHHKTMTVDMLVPAFFISLLGNLIMGGQVLNLYNLDQLAEVAALSFTPNHGYHQSTNEIEDDPIVQLTNLQRAKEEKFGKKTDFLRRKKLFKRDK